MDRRQDVTVTGTLAEVVRTVEAVLGSYPRVRKVLWKSDHLLIGKTRPNMLTWGERIRIEFSETNGPYVKLRIRSESIQLLDWGVHTRNLRWLDDALISSGLHIEAGPILGAMRIK